LLVFLITLVNCPIAKHQLGNQVVTNESNLLGSPPSSPSGAESFEFEVSNANNSALIAQPSLNTSNYLQIDAEVSAGPADVNEMKGDYHLIWEPNRVQGSVHSVATYEIDSIGNALLAIGAGYLYDNEIHIYRWNTSTEEATHVWDCGDGIITGDILSLTFGETDMDGYLEIVAGSADRKTYVFEQRSNLADNSLFNEFQLVWNSSKQISERVISVAVDDLDSDGFMEIVAGSWDGKVYMFEYEARYGTPGATGHRHMYTKVWDSGETIKGRVNSVATGNTDADIFREIIVGASDNRVYIFENNQSLRPEPFYPHMDNVYIEIWNSSDLIFGPIQSVAVSNTIDNDAYGEIVASSSGHGVYVFDYDPELGGYSMNKLLRPVEDWEKEQPFPIDLFMDSKVSGNETQGVFEPSEIPDPYGPEFLYEGATAMAGSRDWWITLLNATATEGGTATTVLDFGKDEEVTGGGNSLFDLTLYGVLVPGKNVTLENFVLYISKNNVNFSKVEQGINITSNPDIFRFTIDIDLTLHKEKWEWFRYLKIETTTEAYVDAANCSKLNRPASHAVSVSIGYVPGLELGPGDYTTKIIIGTVTGNIMVFSSVPDVPYNQTWDSYRPIPLYQPGTELTRRRLSLETNIWSIDLLYCGSLPDIKIFMVAGTNPKVSFVHVNATSLEASVVWDTSPVLDQWTMSVKIADTDGDGKKEVIVGSFDNNIYTFEHVYGNTYRRTWRSPDLKHNETFWDDVTDLTVGDADQDGMMEIIAANNNVTYPQLYVFENIGNDRYAETQRIHLPKGAGPISAISIGDDLDGDGVKEIVVAARNNIYVYEDTTLVSNITLPIDPYQYYLVRSVVTGDTDKDGLGEIICGGVYAEGGLLHIYENNVMYNEYQTTWSFPYAHTFKCPVNNIVLGDQDNDNKTEIIVGHDMGINVYENTGNNAYETAHILTSSATYPQIVSHFVTQTTPPNETITSPPAIMQLKNGTFVMAYQKNVIDPVYGWLLYSNIYTSTSSNGVTWSPGTRISRDTDYPDFPGLNVVEMDPSIIECPNGTIWVTYRVTGDWDGDIGRIYVVSNNGTGWTTPLCLNPSWPNPSAAKSGPSIFNYVYGIPTLGGRLLGVCWVGQNGSLFMAYYAQEHWESPIAVNSLIAGFWAEYPEWPYAWPIKVIALKDGSYALVFNGYNLTSTKHDYDVFIMFSNDTMNWSPPFNITIAFTDEYYPSIIQMSDESLIVVYQVTEYIGHTWTITIISTNRGISWGKMQVLTGPTITYPTCPTVARLNNDCFIYAYVLRSSFTPVYTIYAGVNPVYGWWSLTIGPASCLVLGDTDNDGQREIIAASHKNVYIFELNTTTQRYSQKWVSQQLPQLITDIATGDIDNDGIDEIVVTAARGNVYAFKWIKEEET
jgi:hypothetical protein